MGQGLPADGRLTIVPMPVMVGEEIYGEGEDDMGQTIAVALAAGKPVQTSRPSPGQFERAYRRLRTAAISGAVSVQFPARSPAPRNPPGWPPPGWTSPSKSWTAAPWEWRRAWGSKAHCSRRQPAADPQRWLRRPGTRRPQRGSTSTCPAWSSCAAAGGSAPPRPGSGPCWPSSRSWRSDGQGGAAGTVRTAAKAVARLEELVRRDIAERPDGTARLAIHHFGNEAAARELSERLRQAIPVGMEVYLTGLPAVLAAHAGLGVLAVIVGDNRFPPAAIS